MGLAASQARLLTITARLADNELRSQTINNAKMRLATQSSQASDDYISALNNAQLMFSNTDVNGLARNQVLTYNNLTEYSQYNNQYGLVNSAGLLLVSEQDAKIYEASHGDMNAFLEAYGLEWGTTFFEEGGMGSTTLSEKLTSFYGVGTDAKTGLYKLGVLFNGMTNADLEKLYQDAQTEECSIERMNYDIYSKAYYNQIKDLKETVMPLIRKGMFGDSNTTDEEKEAQKIADKGNANDIINYLLNGPSSTDGSYDYSLNGLKSKGIITNDAYNELSLWVKSLTDRNLGSGYNTGVYDVNLPYSPGTGVVTGEVLSTAGKHHYNWDETISTSSFSETYDKYVIAGIEIGFDVPQLETVGTVTKDNKDSDGNITTTTYTDTYKEYNGYKKPYVINVVDDGEDATYNNPETIANQIQSYLSSQGVHSSSAVTNVHVEYIVENILQPNGSVLDPGGADPYETKSKDRQCIYRYIDGQILRVPMAGYRADTTVDGETVKSFYYDFALTYFQQILQAAANVDIQKYAATGDPGLSAYKEAMANFQLYDKEPVEGTKEGDGSLTNTVTATPAYLLNFVEMLQYVGQPAKTLISNKFGSDAFKSVLKTYLSDLMLDVLGAPKYTWIDVNDPNGGENADAKAQWYENLFNRMQRGYKVLENGLANSKEWIEYAFESGLVTMEQVDKSYNWIALDYKACTNIYEESDTSDLVAKAEAKYNRAMNDIKQKDNMYDLQLKNIDTEHQSLQTEYDSVKGVMNKNIERTMKFDQSA